jgi:hypothetical protein
MEILTKINTIIELCNDKTQKQHFYILLQDLSKAYDRVNLDLLRLALERISLPQQFINITMSLFKNHHNQIIFENHLSDRFDLTTGIIQGESICPLLWVIYYDPMFQVINKTSYGGITLSTTLTKNIYQNDDFHKIDINMKLQGYLDDTTWLSDNLDNLNNHLKLANEFYDFANIHINKSKTKLLTNNNELIQKKSIPFNFGNEIIDVQITPKNGSKRILGVFFNPFNNNSFTIKKINRILHNLKFSITKKKLTHDHIIYIVNKVILPKIEYLTQHFVVPLHNCNHFNTLLRLIFKTSLSLQKSIYNSVVHNQLFPNIINFFELQLRYQSSLLTSQAFSPLTMDCIKLLFLTSQKKFFYLNNIAQTIASFTRPLKCFTRIENLLYFTKFYNISISQNFSFPVKSGTYPIIDFLISDRKNFFIYLKSLTNKQIMFLDQIITADNSFLLPWKEIKAKLKNKRGPVPKWYTFLSENLVLNPSTLRLNITLTTPSIQNPLITRPRIPSPSDLHIQTKNTWVASWLPQISDTVYGKILSKTHFPSCTPMAYIEHWTFDNSFDSSSNNTPKSRTQTIIPCNGCKLHNVYYTGDICPKCVLWIPISNLIIINVSNVPQTSHAHRYSSTKKRKILKKAHSTIRQLTFTDHNARNNPITLTQTSTPDSSSLTQYFPSIHPTNKHLINTLLLTDQTVKNTLLAISNSLHNISDLEFWTDGSLKQLTPFISEMGFGWVLNPDIHNNIEFCGSLKHFASSTKAECFALLTCLIVSPPDSNISIFTDSLCMINTYNSIFHTNLSP